MSSTSGLSMYTKQPTEELTLYDFEVIALDRLRVLKGIELAKAKGAKPDELGHVLKDLTRKHLGGDLRTPEARRHDEVSHHILRLAYCQSDEKRKWFLAQETALFRWRLEREAPEQVSDFMRRADMHLEHIDDEERSALRSQLAAVWAGLRPGGVTEGEWSLRLAREPVFKVPFTQALELVATRRAVVSGGFAYVPRERLTHIIVGRFRSRLSLGLVQAAKALPGVLRDERLGPVLGNMSKAYLGPQYGSKPGSAAAGEEVRAVEVDGLAKTSFPVCMHTLHRALSESHHLRHGGRMQYGLFLKGLGLSLEEAMVFWQAHFTKKMTGEEFVKRYAYNIRHNYGKEGKRASYTAYSCIKIIMGTPPGAGEFHGCPYRHWDQPTVRKTLLARGLAPSQVETVMGSVRSKEYQLACRREFEARMGVEDDSVGNHPNGYYEACQRVIKARAAEAGGADKAEAGGAAAASASSSSSAPGFATASSPAPRAAAASGAASAEA